MSHEADKEGNTRAERQDDAESQQQQIGPELAKAFQELAKGERTASALENRLDGIEDRINQLLASMEGDTSSQPSNGEAPNEKSASDQK